MGRAGVGKATGGSCRDGEGGTGNTGPLLTLLPDCLPSFPILPASMELELASLSLWPYRMEKGTCGPCRPAELPKIT
eukprot:bmy_04643T0